MTTLPTSEKINQATSFPSQWKRCLFWPKTSPLTHALLTVLFVPTRTLLHQLLPFSLRASIPPSPQAQPFCKLNKNPNTDNHNKAAAPALYLSGKKSAPIHSAVRASSLPQGPPVIVWLLNLKDVSSRVCGHGTLLTAPAVIASSPDCQARVPWGSSHTVRHMPSVFAFRAPLLPLQCRHSLCSQPPPPFLRHLCPRVIVLLSVDSALASQAQLGTDRKYLCLRGGWRGRVEFDSGPIFADQHCLSTGVFCGLNEIAHLAQRKDSINAAVNNTVIITSPSFLNLP